MDIQKIMPNKNQRTTLLTTLALLIMCASCSTTPDKPDDTSAQANAAAGDAKEEQAAEAEEQHSDMDLPEVDVPYEKFTLENGLTVIVHEDHKAPVVAVNIWYHVGSKDEKPGRTGFAHLFEHLMFQGSENFQGEFFEPLEKAGATDMNGTTNRDRTNYFQTVPTSALDVALWMESDRMGHFEGAISQERLDEQRGVVQNEKRQGLNRPYGEAWEIIPPNTYPSEHPYSWSVIGSMDDLNAASLEDVKGWFDEYYGASNAVLVLAGDITPEQAKEKAEHYFGHIDAGPQVQKRGPWVAKLDERKELTTFDQVPQERSYYVYNLPPYGREVTEQLRLASRILGKGKNSRLYERLVYRDQLATNVYVWFGDSEISSQMYIIADARPGVSHESVEAAIDEEVAKFIAEGPTKEELDRVRVSYFSKLVTGLEKVGGFRGKANLLAKHETFLGDPGAFKRLLDVTKEASTDDVQQAAAEWLGGGVFVLRVLPDPEFAAASKESKASRDGVPEIGDAPSLDLPDLQRAELSNGLKVVLAERHDVPVVRFKLLAKGGYAVDHSKNLGRAQLAMDVLNEGTDTRGALELAAELERLGAGLSSGANLDFSYVNLETLSTTVDPALDVFADVILNPAFAKEELERRRKNQLAAIEQEESRPFGTALRMLGPLVFGEGQAYGMPLTGSGTKETVEALTREDLLKHHEIVFRPSNATLLVVGDTTMDEIKPKLEQRFADWKPTPLGGLGMQGKHTNDSVRVFLVDKPDAEQSLIVAGNQIPAREKLDQIAVEVMNAVIGGTFTSRINMNLREDKHWSYGARSFIYETQGSQLFAAYANVQTDKTSESMAEIQKELSAFIGDEPVTEQELEKIQQNKSRKLPGQNETSGEVLGSITEIVKYDLPDDYYDTYSEKLQNLTREQVEEAARANIKLDQMTWIVIGDLDKIEEKVRALELGDVQVIDREDVVD
ncbi:MAG: M16 family metallopeptidase [Myxococcota bacterium]